MGLIVNLRNQSTSFYDRTELLKSYYNEVKNYEVLSAEEQLQLFRTYKYGHGTEKNKAREMLIKSNQRFVIGVAKKFGTDNTILDLINEGNIGLMEAIEKYDDTKNVPFISFAVFYIRRSINTYNLENSSMVKKTNLSKTYHIISKATNQFIQQELRMPTNDELMELLNSAKYSVDIKDANDLTPIKMTSVDESFNCENEESCIGDMSLFNSYSASSNAYERTSNEDYYKELVHTLLNKLSGKNAERDKKIIKMCFGIDAFREYTNEEIAKEIGTTTERVRQLKDEIMTQLKNFYAEAFKQL